MERLSLHSFCEVHGGQFSVCVGSGEAISV